MEGNSEENPLGLPRDDQGGVHQLELQKLEGTEYDARSTAGIRVVRFQPTLPNGVAIFNSLTLTQQIAVTLIIDKDKESHQRLGSFLRAPAAFRELALVN